MKVYGRYTSLGDVVRRKWMPARGSRWGGTFLEAFLGGLVGVVLGWGIVLLMTRHGWWLPWR